jgi:hypothetical protein
MTEEAIPAVLGPLPWLWSFLKENIYIVGYLDDVLDNKIR